MDFVDEFANLIGEEDIKNFVKDKANEYLFESIPRKDLAEYQKKGWEVQKEYKTKIRIKKQKAHNDYFEDRVWTLMANLGFKILNKDSNFKIVYSKDKSLSKQIDVFAANDEVVLIIECKSSETLKNKDFSQPINEIGHLRERIISRVKQVFGKEYRFAFLFCTNNCIVSEPDQNRMKDSNILWLNQDDIKYFEKLILSIKEATIYQFLGRIFAHQKIPKLKNTVPAIKGMMGGYPFYSFAIEPSTLLQISYVLHRMQTTEETLSTYQRIVSPKRIEDIRSFLDDGNFFPNAIIINIDQPKGQPLQFDLLEKNSYDAKTKIGILHLPQVYHCGYIIDGQHRLYGYAGSQYKDNNTIPVIAFENLPAEEQAKLFVDINSKQKTVKKNLLITLDAELRWNSPNKEDAVKALKSRLLQQLSEKQISPLYQLISIGENSSENAILTLSFLLSYGFGKTNFFGQLQKKTIIKAGYLCDKDDLSDASLRKAFSFLKDALNYVKELVPEQWNSSSPENPPFLLRNVGLSGLFRLFNDIFEYLENNQNIICNTTSAKTLFEKTKPFLEILAEQLQTVPESEIARMSRFYGSGGPEKVEREFQRLINEVNSDFNPPGLEEYIRDSSGRYNEEILTKQIDFFESCRKFIFDSLRKNFDDSWWDDGIPEKVRKACAIARIENGNQHELDYYIDKFSTLGEIVEGNWASLGKCFSDPEISSSKRKEKIKWLVKFDEFQDRVTKPDRDPITEKEYVLITATIDRVCKNIENNKL